MTQICALQRVVIPYRRFGTTYRSQIQGTTLPLKFGLDAFPETSVRDYYYFKVRKIVVRRFEYVSDPDSYTSGSVATGRASLAGQVEG